MSGSLEAMNLPETKFFMAVVVSGIVQRISAPQMTRRRSTVLTTFASSQNRSTALKYESVKTLTLPPGQKEIGRVRRAQANRPRTGTISDFSFSR
jgi:hypothetical protein